MCREHAIKYIFRGLKRIIHAWEPPIDLRAASFSKVKGKIYLINSHGKEEG